MDADVKAALADIKDAIKELSGKLDAHMAQFNQHCLEDARAQESIGGAVKAAHHRLDELMGARRTEQGQKMSLWVGVILAVIGAGASAAFAVLSKGGH